MKQYPMPTNVGLSSGAIHFSGTAKPLGEPDGEEKEPKRFDVTVKNANRETIVAFQTDNDVFSLEQVLKEQNAPAVTINDGDELLVEIKAIYEDGESDVGQYPMNADEDITHGNVDESTSSASGGGSGLLPPPPPPLLPQTPPGGAQRPPSGAAGGSGGNAGGAGGSGGNPPQPKPKPTRTPPSEMQQLMGQLEALRVEIDEANRGNAALTEKVTSLQTQPRTETPETAAGTRKRSGDDEEEEVAGSKKAGKGKPEPFPKWLAWLITAILFLFVLGALLAFLYPELLGRQSDGTTPPSRLNTGGVVPSIGAPHAFTTMEGTNSISLHNVTNVNNGIGGTVIGGTQIIIIGATNPPWVTPPGPFPVVTNPPVPPRPGAITTPPASKKLPGGIRIPEGLTNCVGGVCEPDADGSYRWKLTMYPSHTAWYNFPSESWTLIVKEKAFHDARDKSELKRKMWDDGAPLKEYKLGPELEDIKFNELLISSAPNASHIAEVEFVLSPIIKRL